MLNNKSKLILKIAFPLAGIFFLVFLFVISAPPDFPLNKIIVIEKGATLKQIAADFEQKNLVRFPILFDMLIRWTGHETDIKAGKYVFNRPFSVIGLALRLISGDYGVPAVKITLPEGSTIDNINKIFQKIGFENFEIKDRDLEGYLFPDTYFFSAEDTLDNIVVKMKENLKNKTAGLEREIKESGRTFRRILTMASLIEKEAADSKDRKIISGILWKRLDEKMLLQVDATLDYVLGKNTFELTTDDLKIDSPYNTYTRIGLPPTPICNPGLDAINAALFPEESPYWYYLSDKEGNTYYAKTFEEHKLNKAKYLK